LSRICEKVASGGLGQSGALELLQTLPDTEAMIESAKAPGIGIVAV
jgi:hypothetical protein